MNWKQCKNDVSLLDSRVNTSTQFHHHQDTRMNRSREKAKQITQLAPRVQKKI